MSQPIRPYYEDVDVSLYHGDCLAILPMLPSDSVESVITSPPYNLVREHSGGGANSKMRNIDDEFTYQQKQKKVIAECLRIAAGSVFYNHKIRYAHARRGRAIHPLEWLSEFPLWTEIIWDRSGGQGGNNRRVIPIDERIYQLGAPRRFNQGLGLTTIWRFKPARPNGHPCPFPEQLPTNCILLSTNEGDTVLDPFAGSGTTLVSALRHNRRAIGIEQSKVFCDHIIERLRQRTIYSSTNGEVEEVKADR